MAVRLILNAAVLGGGNIVRLAAGMVVFVVLARTHGPASFGVFVVWLSVATIMTTPINFGFSTMLLRQFGREPDEAHGGLSAVLTARLLIGGGVLVLGIVVSLVAGMSVASVFIPLLLAQIAESFSDHFALSFRIKRQYATEAGLSACLAALHIGTMVTVCILTESVELAALGFLASRVVGFLWTRAMSRRIAGAHRRADISTTRETLRRGMPFGIELGLLTLMSQIDSLLIGVIAGPRAVGLYQAGMKLVLGASRIGPVVAQVLLPEMARNDRVRALSSLEIRVIAIFTLLGASGAIALFASSSRLVDVLFGVEYGELKTLMPVFGLMFMARMVETGVGLVLVARGLQHRKVWVVLIQLLVMVGAGTYALATMGLQGLQFAVLLSFVVALSGYARLITRT